MPPVKTIWPSPNTEARGVGPPSSTHPLVPAHVQFILLVPFPKLGKSQLNFPQAIEGCWSSHVWIQKYVPLPVGRPDIWGWWRREKIWWLIWPKMTITNLLCAHSTCTRSEEVLEITKEWRMCAKVACWRQYRWRRNNHGQLANVVRNMRQLIGVMGAPLYSKYNILIFLHRSYVNGTKTAGGIIQRSAQLKLRTGLEQAPGS